MEALGISVPLEVWAAMLIFGVSALIALYAREIWAFAGGAPSGRRLKALHEIIRDELDRIEEAQGSELSRAVSRRVLAGELKALKIPCPSPQYEPTWRIFLARLVVSSAKGDVKEARGIMAGLREHMVQSALLRLGKEGREE